MHTYGRCVCMGDGGIELRLKNRNYFSFQKFSCRFLIQLGKAERIFALHRLENATGRIERWCQSQKMCVFRGNQCKFLIKFIEVRMILWQLDMNMQWEAEDQVQVLNLMIGIGNRFNWTRNFAIGAPLSRHWRIPPFENFWTNEFCGPWGKPWNE